jgi:hypothetical protein
MKRLPVLDSSVPQIVHELHRRLKAFESGGEGPDVDGPDVDGAPAVLSSGCAALDRLLPTGGFPRGSLVEWLADEAGGAGAGVLAMLAAREASIKASTGTNAEGAAQGKAVVVLDRQQTFYPPAAAALGVDLETAIVVRARSAAEELWALDQILRCPGVAAVWGPVAKIDPRWFRRLQLAAERGGALGLLLRPASVRGRPSWAWAQIGVAPVGMGGEWRVEGGGQNPVANALRGVRAPRENLPSHDLRAPATNGTEAVRHSAGGGGPHRRWRLDLIRCRAGGMGQGHGQGPLEVELDRATGVVYLVRESNRDPETHSLRLAAELARAKASRRASAS